MVKVVKKSVIITSIRRTFNKNRPDLPGNLLINEGPNQIWLGAVDYRNFLLSKELEPSTPSRVLEGCSMTFDQLDLTQAELEANGGAYHHQFNGREIVYKTPGIKHFNFNISLANAKVTESDLNLAKLSQMYKTERRTATAAAAAPAPAPETMDNTVDAPAEVSEGGILPEELNGIITDGEGNHTNADGTPLSPEQKASLEAWVNKQAEMAKA